MSAGGALRAARFDGDEGGISAYPRFTKERTQMAGQLVNRPHQQR